MLYESQNVAVIELSFVVIGGGGGGGGGGWVLLLLLLVVVGQGCSRVIMLWCSRLKLSIIAVT
jgi:hypothetical protein